MTPLAAVLLLSLVHLGAGRLEFLRAIPRSRLLSFASGVAIAFVFVHLIPLIAATQSIVAGNASRSVGFVERNVWLFALMGLMVFYGLERMVLRARRPSRALGDGSAAGGTYWVHISAFALYNALVGYLLAQPITSRSGDPILFAIALVLHFTVNDIGLRTHYKRHHGRIGQWILVLAPPFGWAMARGGEFSEAGLSALVSFLAGGILINTLKEELPEDREASFWVLALGAALFSAVAIPF